MLLVSATGWRAAATPENYFLFFISFLLRKKKVIYFMNKNQTSDRRDDHFPLNIRFKHRGWNLFICEFEDEIISETNMLSAADSHHVISAQQRKLNLWAQSSSAARTFRTAARKKHNYLRGDCSACFLISGWFHGKIIWLVGIFVWAAASGGRGM